MAATLLQEFSRLSRDAAPGAPADSHLTDREVEVLRLVARGASNQEIARALHVSQATVKSHLIHIFGKLGVSDRTAAVTVALERGILRLDG